MQGVTFQSTVQRGIQRLLGNMAGAAIAAGLLALSPGYWQAVLAVVAFQVTAELLVVKNYALLSIAVTPMALILTGLAGHLSPAVAIDRVGDTLVGVLIVITVAAVTIEISTASTCLLP
ncbi:MAG: FUSC family protein [Rhodococcus sp. (in: high G+C Gram-positive bacteria)]